MRAEIQVGVFAFVSASLCAVNAMLPPSARNIPYFCMARATTCAADDNRETSYDALRRKRAPYGGVSTGRAEHPRA